MFLCLLITDRATSVALVIELSKLVPTDEVELQSALAAYLKVTQLGANLSLDRAVALEEQVNAISASLSLLYTEIQRPRWRLAILPGSPP